METELGPENSMGINEQTAIKQTMDFGLTLAGNSRFQIKVKPAENMNKLFYSETD